MFSYQTTVRAIMMTVAMCLTVPAQAAIVIDNTRVVYPGNEKSVSVNLTNKGAKPVLVQSWIDDGDLDALPEDMNVPFILTPPINRVEPDKSQVLRVAYTGNALPKDRETIFWLNVLEVPAKGENLENKNILQMAFRTRIKLFYRPEQLAQTAKHPANKLTWNKSATGLVIENPSPFYISLTGIELKTKDGENKSLEADMIAPFSKVTIAVDDKQQLAETNSLTFNFINDFGGAQYVDKKIN